MRPEVPQEPLPVGPEVDATPAQPPSGAALEGRFVRLRRVDPDQDAQGLFDASHGTPDHDAIWTYLSYGPFSSAGELRALLTERARSRDPLFMTVLELRTGSPVGMTSFMNIVPEMRRLELGHIWYGLDAQRTKVNTETIYLMLREVFEALGYRRAEWKCDSLNARSRAAALRLGFRYEGLFRQHVITKGRSRDTAWYAMMDHEWPAVRENMERWLYDPSETRSLAVLQKVGGGLKADDTE